MTIFITDLQQHVKIWILKCFNVEIANDKTERSHRFIEESLELVQACGMSKDDVLTMVDYTYDRPLGELSQEVGGVMITLAALCNPHSLNMFHEAENELERINKPEIIDKIREKQKSKPSGSPLPGKDAN